MLALLLSALVVGAAPAASPSLALEPSTVRPGDVLLVRVTGATSAPGGAVAGRTLRFWRAGEEEWRALAALPIETTPGTMTVRVEAGVALAADLTVVEPGFTHHAITVDRRFVEPPPRVKRRIEADRKAFARAFAQPFSPPLFQGSFDWPRRAPTSGRYGDQRVLNGKAASVHYGLDITGPRGSPVAASNDGEVVVARDAYFSGKTVVVWHGADLFTVYFHLDRIAVRQGQRLRKGAVVGALGSTGRATGPHLHWGAKVGGLYVDPESLLGIDFAGGTAPARRAGAPEPVEPPEPEEPAASPASTSE